MLGSRLGSQRWFLASHHAGAGTELCFLQCGGPGAVSWPCKLPGTLVSICLGEMVESLGVPQVEVLKDTLGCGLPLWLKTQVSSSILVAHPAEAESGVQEPAGEKSQR